MIKRVSRRNERQRSKKHNMRELLLLTVSCAVFLGGAASLAWALAPAAAESPPAPAPAIRKAESSQVPYGDLLHAPAASDADPGAPEDAAQANDDAGNANPASERGEESDSDAAMPNALDAPAPPAAQPSAPAQREEPAASQQAVIIHHTAYREESVYRTVHHQASTAREVVVDGRARIEWSLCPVCMQRHDRAFNERVLDHVNPAPCVACGARHEAAFDETRYL